VWRDQSPCLHPVPCYSFTLSDIFSGDPPHSVHHTSINEEDCSIRVPTNGLLPLVAPHVLSYATRPGPATALDLFHHCSRFLDPTWVKLSVRCQAAQDLPRKSLTCGRTAWQLPLILIPSSLEKSPAERVLNAPLYAMFDHISSAYGAPREMQ